MADRTRRAVSREEVPSALVNPTNRAFDPPLVDIAEIISGGPPPDGIPSIDNPIWHAADSVDWIDDREPVILVELHGEARAYPVQIMTWHELVNDTIGDTPVTVSYCPLCNSAITFDRRVGHRVLDFGTSGMLYQSAMVMYDRQTESLWSHFSGEAIAGHLVGARLEVIPSPMISWGTFRDHHESGVVLSRDTGYHRDYGRNPYPGYDDVATSPFLFRGSPDERLLAKTRVVGLRRGTDAVAIPTGTLAEQDLLELELDGTPIVVFHAEGLASALDAEAIALGQERGQSTAFQATIDGRRARFHKTTDGWADDTGTTWDFLGRALAGPRRGSQLERVAHVDTFWFAWAAFMPKTRIHR